MRFRSQIFECGGKRLRVWEKAYDPMYTATSGGLANSVHLNLKVRALRGALAKLCGQAGNFVLRLGFLAVLARLLSPQDFGLVAMVTVVTGVFALFTSAGLSSAAIQRHAITNRQISTLFWINILVGTALGAVCVGTASALVQFYHEPRLFWVTIAIAAGFVLNAAGVQHSAILQREMRYVAVTAIELLAQLASIAVGISMALAGFGYWALVGAAIISSAMSTAAMWVVTGSDSARAQMGRQREFYAAVWRNHYLE